MPSPTNPGLLLDAAKGFTPPQNKYASPHSPEGRIAAQHCVRHFKKNGP